MDNTSNIKRFEELMSGVSRDGKDALMDYIRNKSDHTGQRIRESENQEPTEGCDFQEAEAIEGGGKD